MRQNNFRIFKEQRPNFRLRHEAIDVPHATHRWIRDLPLRPNWWSQPGSNRRPPACKAGALPAELWPLTSVITIAGAGLRPCRCRAPTLVRLVGLGGFEPPTSPLSGVRSDQLSYRPGFIEFVCLGGQDNRASLAETRKTGNLCWELAPARS
jgi:hypothetical protein